MVGRSMILGLIILAVAQLAMGQLTDREIGEMRKSVGVPVGDQVRVNSSASLTNKRIIRTYLSVKMPGSERRRFQERIVQWNLDNAGTIRIEETARIEDAEVVVVQFISQGSKMVEESTLGVKIGKVGDDTSRGARVAGGNEVRSLDLPIYSYLLMRDDTVWTISYSGMETSDLSKQRFDPSARLWNSFVEKMNGR